jgi:CheY-like chemotaxis protein
MNSGKRSILVVDDDPDVVWGLGRYLTREGFLVTTCGDGADALSLIESKRFDVVITDIRMPRLNGLALVHWLGMNRPEVRVVVMTGFGGPSVRDLCLRKGAELYLEKPVDPHLLTNFLSSSSEKFGFSGIIDQIDILDYVQLLMLTGRQVVVEILCKNGQRARLFMNDGRVCHAECGDLEGEEAFYKCVAFTGGSFVNLPWSEPGRTTVTRPGDYLLMEAARRRDEERRVSQ